MTVLKLSRHLSTHTIQFLIWESLVAVGLVFLFWRLSGECWRKLSGSLIM